MRVIDADALMEKFVRLDEDYVKGIEWDVEGIERMILYAPTVDAVPVVRCKDCLYYEPFQETPNRGTCNVLIMECSIQDEDYCSYGERRCDG